MPRDSVIAELHESVNAATDPEQPEGGDYEAPTNGASPAPVSQTALDAKALGYPESASSDANALQDMLEQSLKNELKASRAYKKWADAQGKKGEDLRRDCATHRQRTSRLYHLLTGGIDGGNA